MEKIQKEIKRDVIWNACGSLVYAMASMILAFLVIRIAGEDEGGIFGFGFSTLGQQMFIVSYFGIRPFHITDMSYEYGFNDYLGGRRISTLAAILMSGAFLIYKISDGSYNYYKAAVLMLLCIYKIIDGYSDVYESELQREGKLYRTGQSLTFRTILSVTMFLLVLRLGFGLLMASIVALFMQVLGLIIFPKRYLKKCGRVVEKKIGYKNGFKLLKNTSMLFISVFLDFYIFSASKYAVDEIMTDSANGFFNIIFMPTSFIYLLVNFVIRPMLTSLASSYQSGKMKKFKKKALTLLGAAFIMGLVIFIMALILGKWGLGIFEMMLGKSYIGLLKPLYPAFLAIIAGGAFYAMANVQYYVLITMRRQKSIFFGYLLALIPALFSYKLVEKYKMIGAGVSYMCLMLLLFIIFSFAVIMSIIKEEREVDG